MNRGQKAAVVIALADELLERGSWCGETHVQKGMYLLQDVLRLDSQYEFILYKHGPFSFDLRDQLVELAADGLIEYMIRHPGYGPTLVPTSEKYEFNSRFPKTLAKHKLQLQFVADFMGDRGVIELERFATAVYLMTRMPDIPAAKRPYELIELKPHVSLPDAVGACAEAAAFIVQAKERQLAL